MEARERRSRGGEREGGKRREWGGNEVLGGVFL